MADAKVSDGTQLTDMPLTSKLYVDDAGVDKYVEFEDLTKTGTFTPTIGDGTNDYTTTIADGFYTRAGKLVNVSINITWSSIGSAGATVLRIDDLPYTTRTTANYRASGCIAYASGLDNGGGKQIATWMINNQNYIRFYLLNDNAAASELLANANSSSGSIQMSITYEAA